MINYFSLNSFHLKAQAKRVVSERETAAAEILAVCGIMRTTVAHIVKVTLIINASHI